MATNYVNVNCLKRVASITNSPSQLNFSFYSDRRASRMKPCNKK